MYKFVIVSVIAVVILQGALARQKRPVVEKSQIEEVAEQVRQGIQNVSKTLEGNLPDSKQLSESLTKSAQTLNTEIKKTLDDLAKQAEEHKGDIENALNSIKESLKTTAAKLETAVGPEATQKAKEIKASLDEGLQKAVNEAERLYKISQPEAERIRNDLKNVAKNLLDKAVEVTKDLQTNLQKNLDTKH